MNKKVFIAIVLVLVVVGIFAAIKKQTSVPEPAAEIKTNEPQYQIIGNSVEGRKIESYTFLPDDGQAGGNGTTTRLVFVGGIHGGYEWNSVLLAYQFIDYLKANPAAIPKSLTVTIIPSANPDGLFKVVGKEGRFTVADVATSTEVLASGRFNARGVDLNRNFDCKWQPEATWKNKKVGAGTGAFSEPEAFAMRNFVLNNKPTAVVFWHSQANAVYASECHNGILPQTLAIMNAYAKAAGYGAVPAFTAYPVTGDAEGWLASINVPAITVELKTHESIEWEQNLAGVKALFDYYSKK